MSKYIKLEDAIHNINIEVTGRKEYTGDMKANLFFALDDLPTIEVSEDAISREYMLKLQREFHGWMPNDKSHELWLKIKNAPSVIPKPKEGEWIDKGDCAECSNCGANSGTQFNGVEPVPRKTKFCPDCGAKMKGAE